MKFHFSPLLILLFAVFKSNAQDSVGLFFRESNIMLPVPGEPFRWESKDLLYFETIMNIGDGKYFYIKQNRSDTLTVESGQLMLYKISEKLYLLREGIWALENEDEKVLFYNLGKHAFLNEVRISLMPVQIDGKNENKEKEKQKIRKVRVN